MRRLTLILSLLAASAARAQSPVAAAPAWAGFAGNAQHTAVVAVAPQPFARVRWTASVDFAPQPVGDELLIHYASPMITAGNTVLLPVKGTATGGFRIEGRAGATGAKLWQQPTDWIAPAHTWMPPLPAVLSPQNRLHMAGAGGTVLARATPDLATGALTRVAFYGLADYNANKAAYNKAVQVATPLTSDAAGTVYFGFLAAGAPNPRLASGFARITAQGKASWVTAAAAAADPAMTRVAMNAAPALSRDGATLYVVASDGVHGYLLALDSATLATKARRKLLDPSSGQPAWLPEESSAAPMVGPDGDVYFGVLEQPFPSHNDRGWLLHFDATLANVKIPGSFGWDNTASIVPSRLVPAYRGAASYLLMTKYNNYFGIGTGDGQNRIALLDPTVSQADPFVAAPTKSMAVVQSVLGPTADPDQPGTVYEWCINSAAVDAATGSSIANSEDGHLYHWNLKTAAISESLLLNAPRPEAYTMTVIGPDGTVYAINNATFYAVGK